MILRLWHKLFGGCEFYSDIIHSDQFMNATNNHFTRYYLECKKCGKIKIFDSRK